MPTTFPPIDRHHLYEPGRNSFVTMVADYQPLQDPFAGPNYFTMDPDALYDINIDNDGDALPEITFRFRFTNTNQKLTVPVNGVNVEVPLVNIGPIAAGSTTNLNVVETYTVEEISGKHQGFLPNARGGSSPFTKPADNIGNKTLTSPGD